MKKILKTIALILVSIICVSALTVCKKKNPNGDSSVIDRNTTETSIKLAENGKRNTR